LLSLPFLKIAKTNSSFVLLIFLLSLHTQQRVWVVLFNIFEFQKSKEEVYFGELFGFTLDLQKETANLFLLNNFTIFGKIN